MRIDLFNSAASQVSSDASSTAVSSQGTAKAGQAGSEDRTTLTSDKMSVGSLVSQAMTTPEIRQDKVESLRLSVNSGKYDLDPAKTAASIVNEFA